VIFQLLKLHPAGACANNVVMIGLGLAGLDIAIASIEAPFFSFPLAILSAFIFLTNYNDYIHNCGPLDALK
jgi:hypothetical protein